MNSPFGPNSSSCAADGAYAGPPALAVRSREDEHVAFRIDGDAGDFAEVHARGKLEKVRARIERDVGNALLRDSWCRGQHQQAEQDCLHNASSRGH
jgi:hypothetical protein